MTRRTINSTSDTQHTMVDVVVVGAGLSGLQTAHKIQAAGLSCIVLEATNRVGGKTLTVKSSEDGAGRNDVGAAWINDTNQSEMYKLFCRFGLDGEFQRTTGNSLEETDDGRVVSYPYDGSSMTDHELQQFQHLMSLLDKMVADSDLHNPSTGPNAEEYDKMTFQEYCKQVTKGRIGTWFADLMSRALLGVESDEISLLYIINYFKSGFGIAIMGSDGKNGGQYLRVRQGTQSFAIGISKELSANSIFLSMPVTSIEQPDHDHCIVRAFPSSVFRCKKVVVSVPTSLYSTIKFSPELPESKRLLSEKTMLGYYSKMVYVFSHPWWREHGLSGVFNSPTGPISFTRDTSIEADDQWSISCFIVGEPGRKWSKFSKTKRHEQAWQQFCMIFGHTIKNIPIPINEIEMEWAKQQYFWGAPSPVMGPGIMTTYGTALKTPFENVHFVGTETADVWKGYMEGAVRSGQRGADEVIAALNK